MRRTRTPLVISLAVCGLALAPTSHAVDIAMSVASGSTTLCSGITGGVQKCSVSGLAGGTITVTWSLTSAQTLNGYDLDVSWDPAELTLLSADQLYPDSQAPNSIPFLVAPNPGDPAGSQAVVLSLVGFPTTALFRATFQLGAAGVLPQDCAADIAWSANGNGLAPGSVVLTNPTGAAVDVGIVRKCSNGIDDDGDGKIDFDGGVCAGAPVPTDPDTFCTSATLDREKAASCGLGFEIAPVLLGLFALRRARRARGRTA
jgi:hypothetical protein